MSEFSEAPIISVSEANIVQDGRTVLENVGFNVYKGDFVYLIGKTGSGKSSLLKMLYADLPLTSGSAVVAGFEIKGIARTKIAKLRRKIGIVFQDFQLLTDRTVLENLIFVLKATGWKDKNKMLARAQEVLDKVNLGHLLQKYPHQISGGEQQRVVIARALLNEPQILIADEPTGNLDPEVSEEIMKIFLQINISGTAILMATHDLSLIGKFPNKVLRCLEGRMESVKIE